MNIYRHITLAARLAVLLALHACSDGDEGLPIPPATPTPPTEQLVPLRIASASTGSGLDVDIQTRAYKVLESGQIGLFLKPDPANGYEAISNQSFTYATPFWQTDKELLLSNQPAVIAAYYPYAAETSNPLLLRSQNNTASAGDLCYVNRTASNTTSRLKLDLARVYTRLVVNIKSNQYSQPTGKVTALRLSGTGVVSVATLDMLDQTVSTANHGIFNVRKPLLEFEEAEIKAETTFTTGDATKSGKLDLLLVPTVLTGDITLTLTVDGIELSGKVSATSLCGSDGILCEGVQYEVNLTVQTSKLEISSISIMDWETEDLGKGEIN